MTIPRSRVAITSLAIVGAYYLFAGIQFVLFHDVAKESFFWQWHAWDGAYYYDIAQTGYGGERIVFYPLFPWLIRALMFLGFSTIPAGLFISTISFVVASEFLFRWTLLRSNEQTAWTSVAAFWFFPTAYFLHALYAESLLCAFVFAAAYLSETKNWSRAALCGFLAALTKITGLLLIPYFVFLGFRQKRLKSAFLAAAASSAGVAVYLGVNWAHYDSPFAFLSFQRNHWHRELAWPWAGFLRVFGDFSNFLSANWFMFRGAELAAFFLLLGATVFFLLKKKMSEAFFVTMNLALLACNSLWMSQPRHLLPVFPIYWFVALLLRTPATQLGAAFLGISLQVILTLRYLRSEWAF